MEHEPSIGGSDEWYTPQFIFDGLGTSFDLDPCSPGDNVFCCVPAARSYVRAQNGLVQPWEGFVFMNPPFGGRNGHVPWIRKFLEHGNGIAIVRAYTSSGWFHDWAVKAHALLFPRGKTKFVRPDGTIGGQPGGGVVLLAMGERACAAMKASGLGFYCSTAQRSGDANG